MQNDQSKTEGQAAVAVQRRVSQQPPDSLFKTENWSIGHYYSNSSICVNLKYDGKHFHRHDHGVRLIPRFIRLGWAIASIEKESGLLKHRDEIHAYVVKNGLLAG